MLMVLAMCPCHHTGWNMNSMNRNGNPAAYFVLKWSWLRNECVCGNVQSFISVKDNL